ncbi:tail assembly protein [Solimicrobium silvestre]|uniref:Phage-related protein tail component n=1 Tax=Solimicrobium silvestre TaxID=2099400 RepID=A0A2S9GZH0_9BURK|nr:tail assembly protein [Solimicrobium silvestre]PRC93100.1 Phage-related protein tail component [Solimicrobium silvestre]
MNQLRTIRLYGKLGNQFGRVHTLAVANVREAVKALSVLLPGFERELLTSKARGIVYAVFIGKKNISKDDLHQPTGSNDIRIAPILQGAKRGGILQTIVGAVLVVVGTYFGQAWAVQAGIGMMLGGVVQMLSPQQLGQSGKDDPANAASYNFNGAVNTTAQGNPVPILYGRMIVGSAVISAGIYSEDKA